MRIEAVTVCVNYGDFLNETARANRALFERWVIVTTPGDEETREVCRKYNLEVVVTDDFTREGKGTFAKARGINRGLMQLSADSWHLHLDADIILPPDLRQLLNAAHLHEDCLYGWDRVRVCGWEAWQKFKAANFLHHDYHCRINFPKHQELGTRWVSPQHGYVPIGYSQLWYASAAEWRGVRYRRYPDRHSTAARTDVQFGLLWDRRQRIHLPEIVALHLEAEVAKLGANWQGRTTKRFAAPGAKTPKGWGACQHAGQQHYPPHPGHGIHGRFCEVCRQWWEERP